MQKEYFLLYANCIIVNGYKESALCDIQFNRVLPIPNELSRVIFEMRKLPISKVISSSGIQDLKSFLNFFITNGLGFYTDKPNLYPKLNLNYFSYSIIESFIVEVENLESSHLDKIVILAIKFKIIALELRVVSNLSFKIIHEVLRLFSGTSVRVVNIILEYSDIYSEEDFNQLISLNPKIGSMLFHSAKSNFKNWFNPKASFTTSIITSKSVSMKSIKTFYSTISTFSEAQHFNIGLNQKIAFDINGNIKNHLSHNEVIVNLNNVNVDKFTIPSNILSNWKISNDKIEKCKDCQFRYICVDNSELHFVNNLIQKSTDCGFDPYSLTWSNNSV